MGRTRTAYPPDFREQMVALVCAGRTPEELARELEPVASLSATGWLRLTGMRGVEPTV